MTEQQARDLLQKLMIAAQRVRSEVIEAHGEEVLEMLYPWLAGNKNILTGLERALAREKIDPMDLYNLVTVANSLVPLVFWCRLNDVVLPEPSIAWLKGFEG